MTERDELARIIMEHVNFWDDDEGKAPEKIIESGYRRHRQINVASELDALPVGSVILDIEYDAWQRMTTGVWWCADQVNGSPAAYLPATLLHDPSN